MLRSSTSRICALAVACLAWGSAADVQSAPKKVGETDARRDRADHLSQSTLVSFDKSQRRLVYTPYVFREGRAAVSVVPDFSRAGYKGGGVALPSRADVSVVRVIVPDRQGKDAARIQQAIDAVSLLPEDARGIRGAVLIKSGRYSLDSTLHIRASGVTVRGEGRGPNGTVLRSVIDQSKGKIFEVGDEESAVPKPADQPRRTSIVGPVQVGELQIRVASPDGYQVGDQIAVVRTPNSEWVGPRGIDTQKYGWEAKRYVMFYERVVSKIQGNIISLDAPVVDTIDDRFGGGYVYRTNPLRIHQVGIEDLSLEGNPLTPVANGTPDTGPYYGVSIGAAVDSWVRNLTIRFVSHGIATRNGAHFNTFEDVSYLEPRYGATQGGRRYVFMYEGNSSFNLTQRCYAEGGRHTFVTGSKVPGPNVFLDSEAVRSTNDSGPHHRWATGTLYDNIKDERLVAQNRGSNGSGHGWAGAQQMFWNSSSAHYVVQSPPFAMNWSVGLSGGAVKGQFAPGEVAGIQQRAGSTTFPRSLYLQQLKDRLGEGAVENIATAAQRRGRVWRYLESGSGSAERPKDLN